MKMILMNKCSRCVHHQCGFVVSGDNANENQLESERFNVK